MAITKRLVKGAALTHTELDGNFTDLDTRVGTLEAAVDSDGQTLSLVGDDLTISGGNTVSLSTLGVGLTSFSATTAAAGTQDLEYDNTTGVFTFTPLDTTAISITKSQISDLGVVLTNITAESIGDLSDVDTTTTPPAAGQVLKWDAPDSKWKPATDSAGSGGIALTDLSLTQASATGTGTLTYNNTTGEFVYTPPDLSGFLTSVPAQTFASLTDINNANGPDIIAIGTLSSAGVEAVSIGKNTGSGGDYSQAIGNNAGNTGQGVAAVALGSQSGETSQGDKAVAVGQYAGQTTQSSQAIAIGNNAGKTTQGSYAVAIGRNAGETTQGAGGIAVGSGAGKTTQGLSGIAIGYLAGESNQGGGAIAIGANAGTLNQAADSIILNASNTALENTQTGSFVVKPVRNASGTHALEYNPTTGEVTYDTAGGGLPSRSTATSTTGSLADTAQADLDITGFKSYTLLTITTDKAARVRLYVNAATRTADAARAEGTDPAADAGLIAEVITTGAETVIISPGAYGFNLESTPTTNIPCRVTNKSGSTGTVQIDLNILQLEA